jgi:hypothetical protein
MFELGFSVTQPSGALYRSSAAALAGDWVLAVALLELAARPAQAQQNSAISSSTLKRVVVLDIGQNLIKEFCSHVYI